MTIRKHLSALLAATTVAATAAIAPTAVAATAPAAAGDDAAVVNAWYTDFLGRSSEDDPASRYWVQRLGAQAPADVVWALTHTGEFNANGVDHLYSRMLQRTPDAGARYWLDGVDAGRFPLEWVEQNIAASPEYVNAPGVDLVARWYGEVFGTDSGRQPSAGEITYWRGRIAAVGHLDAFRELYYTPEAITLRIEENYYDLIDRLPTTGELSYWYPREVESDINVAVLIASTPEYATLVH